ncbi:Protein phosphatase 2C 32 [Acorus gramineus]|uniref:protein-serine/threonine phosphatase n=1 Tax=Acorus gramineus TaxID=55184 RepID=A0AAV9BKX1_ACOGR|nr:Protein phosphatase 2C 32 [Acorus gramineus]
MGNSTSRVVGCLVPSLGNGDKDGVDLDFLGPLDEGLGHSFCYVRPTHSGSFRQELGDVGDDLSGPQRPNKNFQETTFKTISGASVSANVSTARTVNPNVLSLAGDAMEPAASFESTASFAAIPLQPVPRGSGPLNGFLSGPLERGFASGPLERGGGFMSGPIEKGMFMSGPLDGIDKSNFSAPLAYGRRRLRLRHLMRSMSRPMKSGWMQREAKLRPTEVARSCVEVGPSEVEYRNSRNLQWAHGKAGEDRVHVVLSEEQGWLFVGIYDGFSGPDAPDFLMSNLYRAIDKELEGLLWDHEDKPQEAHSSEHSKDMVKRSLIGAKIRQMYRKQKSLRKKLFPWSYDWHREQTHVEERMKSDSSVMTRRSKLGPVDHVAVLNAMSRALEVTEEAYMEMVESSLDRNPELALMGSCVLVMLMKDQDVYVINLGDSRAILAQDMLNDRHTNPVLAKDDNKNNEVCKVNKNREISICRLKMRAVQLSTDHSTNIEEEVVRIKAEHVDDSQAVFNDRVKGQLKVTRAFGAGFLKKSVCHHRLCSSDRFLVLSSDGLYEYFSNEEVVSHVAWFMENVPEGDPAQYLIAELLCRAAKKNGMDFHELLHIPQGDRRKYHDDVSVMVVSLEGRIWRSSG